MAELGEANIGGRMVPAWLLNLTAEELDSLKSRWYSNPNLLDNWYFGNPVNQRGKAEYSGNSYCIDRWFAGNNKVTLEDDGLLITSVEKLSIFRQYIEFPKLFSGRTVTFSVDSEIVSGSWFLTDLSSFSAAHTDYAIHNGVTSYSFPVNNSSAQGPAPAIGLFSASVGSQIKVRSIKLELGSQQTLAHQGANGNWVLNEIPDYREQLLRCQRYFVNFNPYRMKWFAMPPAVAGNANQAYSAVTLPVAMRAKPVVSYGGSIALSQEGDHAVTAILVSDNTFTGNSVQLRYDVSAGTLTANSLYRVQGNQDTTAYIWLSADL